MLFYAMLTNTKQYWGMLGNASTVQEFYCGGKCSIRLNKRRTRSQNAISRAATCFAQAGKKLK